MPSDGPEAELRVEIVDASRPGQPVIATLRLRPGASIADALQAAGMADRGNAVGIFGRRRPLDEPLSTGDRIELYRPLLADPKLARRSRAKRA